MKFRYCGKSGLQLPEISLGGWQNFEKLSKAKELTLSAIDHGITYFDFANNYGGPKGLAELNFGKIMKSELKGKRDQLVISSKAGYIMWDGPYGRGGSRKHLLSSADQSLKRLQLDYVDIFYYHVYDPNTPIEESLNALNQIVKQGKAIYAGISNHNAQMTKKAVEYAKTIQLPLVVHQAKVNLLDRKFEKDLLPYCQKSGLGMTVYSALAQGILAGRYANGIPKNSRANKTKSTLPKERLETKTQEKIMKLSKLASSRKQSLSQISLQWILQCPSVTSVIIGASNKTQIKENCAAINFPPLTNSELQKINQIFKN